MATNQITIKKKITLEGIGLHSGIITKITLIPSLEDSGISFVRTDLKKSLPIKANWKNVLSTNLCTKIVNKNGDSVITIEHLMFSLYSLGITNLVIQINGPEVPIFDGSSKLIVDEILKIGLTEQKKKVVTINILQSFSITDKKRFIK